MIRDDDWNKDIESYRLIDLSKTSKKEIVEIYLIYGDKTVYYDINDLP